MSPSQAVGALNRHKRRDTTILSPKCCHSYNHIGTHPCLGTPAGGQPQDQGKVKAYLWSFNQSQVSLIPALTGSVCTKWTHPWKGSCARQARPRLALPWSLGTERPAPGGGTDNTGPYGSGLAGTQGTALWGQ